MRAEARAQREQAVGEMLRRPRLLQRRSDPEGGADDEQHLPVHARAGDRSRHASGEHHEPRADEGDDERRDAGEGEHAHQEGEHAEGDGGPLVTDRARPLDLRDQVEVVAAPVRAEEAVVRVEEERVAGVQVDVAHLGVHHLAVPVDGDDGRVVLRAELRGPHRLADERRVVRDHRLHQRPELRAGRHLVHLVGGGDETPDPAQIHDRVEDAREREAIVGLQPLGGRHRGEDRSAPFDLRQVKPREVAEPGFLDAPPDDRRVGLHDHLDLVPARVAGGVARGPALRQQPARAQQDEQDSRDRGRHAEHGDAPELLLDAGLGHHRRHP